MNFDLDNVTLRSPDDQPRKEIPSPDDLLPDDLVHWPPFPRYLLEEFRRAGIANSEQLIRSAVKRSI